MPKPKYDVDVLQIVLNESQNLKNKQLEHLFLTSENIWSSLNLLLILLGIYTSTLLFLGGDNKLHVPAESIITFPLVFSFLLITYAIIRCVMGIFPTNAYKVITAGSIYESIIKDKETVLDEFIQTYLIGYKRDIIRTELRNSLRKEIVLLALASVLQFVLFVALIFFKDQNTTVYLLSCETFMLSIFNLLSCESFMLSIFVVLRVKDDEKCRINELRDSLNK